MSYPLQREVTDLKTPPCQVLEESTGRIRCVSPTGRHDPATGTAAICPARVCPEKGDERIPAGILPLKRLPKAPDFVYCDDERIADYFCQLEVHSLFSSKTIWLSTEIRREFKRGGNTPSDTAWIYMLLC